MSQESIDNPIPRIIYTFWTGDNDITPNRKRCLQSMTNTCGVQIQLITPENLNEYIKQDGPLPEAYKYLSFVHRSDYLRTYFMYHYGGGYSDIKEHYHSWTPVFDRFEESSKYICGYKEVGPSGVACPEDYKIANLLRQNWELLVGNGAYICRPYTKFVDEWYKETKKRVVERTEILKLHPAKDAFGKNSDYPIPWNFILGQVFHPICYKYHDFVMQDDRIKPSFSNYR